MSKAIIGLMLLFWASPVLMAAIALQSLPNPGSFNSEVWETVSEVEGFQFAGILSQDDQSKLTGVRYLCDGTPRQVRELNFAIPVSRYARLFVERELVPGLNAGTGRLQVTIDDSEIVPLSPVLAGIVDRSVMLVATRSLPEATVRNLMAGATMRIDLFYNGSVMFTDTVSLNGSGEALSGLDCDQA